MFSGTNDASVLILIPPYMQGQCDDGRKNYGASSKLEERLMKAFGTELPDSIRAFDPVLGQVLHMVVNGVNVFLAAVLAV